MTDGWDNDVLPREGKASCHNTPPVSSIIKFWRVRPEVVFTSPEIVIITKEKNDYSSPDENNQATVLQKIKYGCTYMDSLS